MNSHPPLILPAIWWHHNGFHIYFYHSMCNIYETLFPEASSFIFFLLDHTSDIAYETYGWSTVTTSILYRFVSFPNINRWTNRQISCTYVEGGGGVFGIKVYIQRCTYTYNGQC